MAVYLDATGEITPKTYRPASARMYWWTAGRWLFLMAPLGALLGAMVIPFGFPQPLWWIAFLLLWVGIVGGLLLTLRIRYGPPSVKGPRNSGRFHFVATDDGLTVEGPVGTSALKWAAYTKAYVDNKFVYLLLSNRQAQTLPTSLTEDWAPLTAHLRAMGLLRPTPHTFYFV